MYTLQTHSFPLAPVKSSTMKIGDVALILEAGSDSYGHYVLQAYQLLVSLTDPRSTWSKGAHNFDVRLLTKGESMTMVIE